MKRLFANARLILSPDEGIRRGSLLIEGEVISRIFVSPEEGGASLKEADEIVDCGGDFLAPGLIDLHCHGAMGRDAMEATPEVFRTVLDYHATLGTTCAVMTTVAASLDEIHKVLKVAGDYRSGRYEPRLAGIHLEGPYFSRLRCGAHRQEMLRYPSAEETQQLLRHAGVMRRVTLAPEVPGSLNLVTQLISSGITVSAGHSDATEEEAVAGFAAGITQATHLYNCMSSLRSEPGKRFTGLAEAALITPGILCEVIPDGRHLSPTLLRLTWLAKGWESVAIVSDATAGAGLGEGALFDLGGLPCRIEGGSAWTGEGEGRRLAGSTIGMINGVEVMVEHAGIPLVQAVAMATVVPARTLGLEEVSGSLTVGKRADLVRFSDEWAVKGVWINGGLFHSDEGNGLRKLKA